MSNQLDGDNDMQGQRINLFKVTATKILKYGTSMFISAFALLGFIIITNYVLAVRTNYVDITREKINTLSDNTEMLLDNIDFPINIKVFYLSSNQARIVMILNGYRELNDLITLEVIDPLKSPIIAQEYNVTEPGTLIFEAKGTTSRLRPSLLSGTHNEREITLMLYRILTDESRTAYFTEGHGELSINNPNYDGISRIRDRLLEQGYSVESINLQTVEQIPTDNSILIIVEPKTSSTDEEMGILYHYLDYGGSVIVLGAPSINTNVSELLWWHGLAFGYNFVYETASNKTTTLGPTAPLCAPYEPSEIVEGLENQNIIFPYVRSIELADQQEDISYTRILSSSENSWAETDVESAREIQNGTRPSRDENEERGPIIIAYATETELAIPDTIRVGAYRQVVSRSAFFGNARFVSNSMTAPFPANLTLFMNTINWITRNEQIMIVTPNASVFMPVELLRSQRRLINWLSLVLYPSVIVILGIVIWFRKR
ncbi:GldG family protein [Candidatus Latescibacterota bacterium]